MNDDNSGASILRDLILKQRKQTANTTHLRIPRGIFMSLDVKVHPSERESPPILEQLHEQPRTILKSKQVQFSQTETFKKKKQQDMPSPIGSSIMTKSIIPNQSTIRRTQSKTFTGKPQPASLALPLNSNISNKRSLLHPINPNPSNPPTQLLIISLQTPTHQFQIYYKTEGTISDFLSYMSALQPQLSNSLCFNSDTLQLLSLEFQLKDFKSTRVNLEFVQSPEMLECEWEKVKYNKFVVPEGVAGKDFWVGSLEVLREYRDRGGGGNMGSASNGVVGTSQCWYFGKGNYITDQNAHKVRKDPRYYFPELKKQEADELKRSDICGFKIYKNLTYYLQGVGLKVTNLAQCKISKGSTRLYRQTFKQRHEQKNNFSHIVKFLVKTGFYKFARSLAESVYEYFQLSFEREEQQLEDTLPINEFLIQYRQRKISSKDFLTLLQDMMVKQQRQYQFLRDVWIYQFKQLQRPCSQSLQSLRLHNFQQLQDWFFPTLTTITQQQCRHIKQSVTAGKNLIAAYRSYLLLFDIHLNSSYTPVKSSKSLEKFKHPLNRPQIYERVLVSLAVTGMMPLVKKFLGFLRTMKISEGNKEGNRLAEFDSEAKVKKVYGCEEGWLLEHHVVIKKEMDMCTLI